MKNTTTEPRIYVGTYAKYNSGSIAGAWISLDDHDRESFQDACAELHKDEADPEIMFQAFEGFPSEFYSESSLSAALWDWLELDDRNRELLARYIDAIGGDRTIEDAREAFCGTAESVADFAEDYSEEIGSVPKNIPSWIVIDWQATWDCNLRHDYSTSEGDDGTVFFFLRS